VGPGIGILISSLQMIGRFFSNLWRGKGLPWRASRILLAVVLGLILAIKVFENKLIYFPTKYPLGNWDVSHRAPAEGEYVMSVEDCGLTASDGTKLHGWMCAPQQMRGGHLVEIPSQIALLFLHGNGGNITDRYELIRHLVRAPARVFILDYRGYGKSDGSPSERGLYLDAQAAWQYLTDVLGIPARDIVLFGESLGGAVAIDLALRTQSSGSQCAGLIVQSSFTSIPDMAATVIPHFPGFLLHTKMDSLNKIKSVACPKLFIHSRADDVVPFQMGRRLFDAAEQPKQFYEVIGARHNETDQIGGSAYFDTISRFVISCAVDAAFVR
jgi:uncharacterized protein